MSTYTESHKKYYDKFKKQKIFTYLVRGDEEFIKMMKESAQKIRSLKANG